MTPIPVITIITILSLFTCSVVTAFVTNNLWQKEVVAQTSEGRCGKFIAAQDTTRFVWVVCE